MGLAAIDELIKAMQRPLPVHSGPSSSRSAASSRVSRLSGTSSMARPQPDARPFAQAGRSRSARRIGL
jgi:hypothetical protein